jgi:hypothetical protein
MGLALDFQAIIKTFHLGTKQEGQYNAQGRGCQVLGFRTFEISAPLSHALLNQFSRVTVRD